MRSALVALLLAAAGCRCAPLPVSVHAAADLPAPVRQAAEDIAQDLTRSGLGQIAVSEAVPEKCVEGEVHVVVAGIDTTLGEQTFAIDDEACEGRGRRLVLRGGSLLAAQWAAYELPQRLGVRYFHPEQTFHPTLTDWPDGSLATRQSPAFGERVLQVHRTHPVELAAPLKTELDMAAFQKRWIDWNVKLRQTRINGFDQKFVGTYAWDRGFPSDSGINLLNAQQGGRPIIDPDDPRPEEEQIAEAIENVLAPREGRPRPTFFGFQFNPSEFTEVDDQDTVRRLTFMADYFAEQHPDIPLYTINHGTHGEPTAHYGVRFFDLSKFAPENLGVQVHTLMFYDLERPAPVYGNEDFSYMLEFTREQAQKRRIFHYPESSWWLTFDLPVPLYLAPVTLEARQHDLNLLRDLVVDNPRASRGVVGHKLFTTGQEWGYWLIDYCTARMTWDLAFTHERCLEEFTGSFMAGDELLRVLREVERRQVTDMRDPEIIRMLVGSDDATEAAWDAGIQFHPLPPAPADVLVWSDDQVAFLKEHSLEPLRRMAEDYERWAKRVDQVAALQHAEWTPWVQEVADGLRVFGLRAAHALAIYETVLELRAALAAKDLAAVNAAYAGLEKARAITDAAREVIRSREAHYRYPPELTIAGDEAGTDGAIPNSTVYTYRYLSRTHRLFFWERPNTQLAALFGEGIESVRVNRRILKLGSELDVSLLAEGVEDVRIVWGDGSESSQVEPHKYAQQGFFDWTLDARTATGAVHSEDKVAVVERRFVFPRRSLKVREPAGAALIEGLLPGFDIGLGNDGQPFLALGRIDTDEAVAAKGTLQRRARNGQASVSGDLTLALRNVGNVTVHGAVIEVKDGAGPQARELAVTGTMRTGEIVSLLVEVGGFDEPGARATVASVLGETPETLPEELGFVIEAVGEERE